MSVKILVVAPSPKTRGGITSVIKAHQSTYIWSKWSCKWISTYIDRGVFYKVVYFFIGIINYVIHLPLSDIVHIHFSESTSAKRKNIFLLLATLYHKKTILHFHAFSPETTLFGKSQLLYEKMFQRCDVSIALSNIWKNEMIKLGVEPKKINVIYNPCPNVLFNRNIQKNKQNNIIFAGTLNERKGFKDLINAFSNIAEKYSDWNIVFAGNGEIHEGEILSEKLNIKNQVRFLGWISNENKDIEFSQASIFCLPSYAEGFPMAVLDAWAYGLPVITTPVGGLPDVLQHRENALIFNPGDINKLTENLELLITDIKLREKLSAKSFEFSQTIFNLNNIAQQIDNLYLSLNKIQPYPQSQQ